MCKIFAFYDSPSPDAKGADGLSQTTLFIDALYRSLGFSPSDIGTNEALNNLLDAGYRQTRGTWKNLTATTANTVTGEFERALDRAWLQISSGAFDYKTAVKRAVDGLADHMAGVTYPSGHKDTLEVAARRAVLTGVNQTAAQLQLARADEMGCEFVETSAHAGARPEHAVWQGRVFHRGGAVVYEGKEYEDFETATGYGTGAGLCGWNCRHNFYPFFPGLSVPAWSEEELAKFAARDIEIGGKLYTRYEVNHMQRALEREVRRQKRRFLAEDAAGLDTTDAAVQLKEARRRLADFTREAGSRADSSRTSVSGFGRSEAGRATARYRQEVEKYSSLHYNKDGTIVVTDDWKENGKVTIPQRYKPNAVVETQTVYKSGTVQIDRTIYDENGTLSFQIHSGPHNRPDKHPFGKHGEHVHHYTWNGDGKLLQRDSAELSDGERIQHRDILGGEESES